MSADRLRRHCQVVARRLAEGKVIPFLGAGASLCGRPQLEQWQRSGYLPSAGELADHLAESYAYPEEARELVRVSQYVELVAGDAALFEELHSIFGGSYEPNALHALLAALPAALRLQGSVQPGQLLITTNYDDSLERAFTATGEPYDLVYYDTDPNEPGKFVHVRPDGERAPIPRHTDYREFALEERSVILKIHGAVDRADEASDSYVITEDHYIQYLAHRSASELPAYLMARLRSSHFLFLGFGMSDWNVRVFLHLIWAGQVRRFGSWAIQLAPGEIDRRIWDRNGVEIVECALEEWVEAMRAQLP